MSMFSSRMPRKYRRVSVYYDERREKLAKIVDQVKREQGELPAQPYDPTDKFKGQFAKYTPHAQRADEGGRKLAWPIIILLIGALLMIWYFLQTGHLYGRH